MKLEIELDKYDIGQMQKNRYGHNDVLTKGYICLLYTSPSPRDGLLSRMPSSA